MELKKYIEKNIGKIIEWRQQLHSFPELAFKEIETSNFVAKKLKSFGITTYRGLGRTGIVGVLKNGTKQNNIGLRADMDALPILEKIILPINQKIQDVCMLADTTDTQQCCSELPNSCRNQRLLMVLSILFSNPLKKGKREQEQ